MKMPFGKFKGHEISSLPNNYLRWLAENISENETKLKREVCLMADEEYQDRVKNNVYIE